MAWPKKDQEESGLTSILKYQLPREVVAMSPIAFVKEVSAAPARLSPARTWSGALVQGAESATHYLHLSAFPCEKCKGPVILGWIAKRKDEIARETEIKEIGAVCLSCGCRPETPIDPPEACHFRPVQWEWTIEEKSEAVGYGGDPLPAELSQDADTHHN